ncbi:MAG: hypothetical protein PHU85_20210, partial [Phycisphaerae bacterium]|nr:hypothetical protein [Phycisphaerae bacterium]
GTNYVFLTADNTIGVADESAGWPADEHLKLAAVSTADGGFEVSDIIDLRGGSMLGSLGSMLQATPQEIDRIADGVSENTTAANLSELTGGGQTALHSHAGGLANVVDDASPQLGGDLDANGKRITGLASPIAASQPATKSYVDTLGVDAVLTNWRLADHLASVASATPGGMLDRFLELTGIDTDECTGWAYFPLQKAFKTNPGVANLGASGDKWSADLEPGNGDFTFSCDVKFRVLAEHNANPANVHTLIGFRNGLASTMEIDGVVESGVFKWALCFPGIAEIDIADAPVTAGVKYHVEVKRVSGTLTLKRDGNTLDTRSMLADISGNDGIYFGTCNVTKLHGLMGSLIWNCAGTEYFNFPFTDAEGTTQPEVSFWEIGVDGDFFVTHTDEDIVNAGVFDGLPTRAMTVETIAYATVAAPTAAILYGWYTPAEAVVLNTDFALYASRDDGTTWTKATLTKAATLADGSIVVSGPADLSAQPAGTQLKLRVVTTAKGMTVQGLAARHNGGTA